jgi:two-component system cell cycle sensor histidine kinase PleC
LQAFGLNSLPAAGSALGFYAKDIDGQTIVLGTAVAENGLTAFVSRDRAPIEAAWLRSAIMFGLLFLGPVLAAAGIWFLVQGQSERFAAARVQMRDAERRLRVAIEGARCGVWDWDITNDRVYLTQRLAEDFGLTGAGRFDTYEVLQALSAEDQARLRAAFASAAQSGMLDIVVKITRAATVTHVQLRGRAAVDRQRPDIIRAIGVSIDVSEERNSEARVTAAERRLRDAIDSISGPFALWSKERRLILWNGGFAKTFGLDGSILHTGASYNVVSAAAAKSVKSQQPDRYDELAQEIELDNGVWIQLVERETSDGGLVSVGIDISPLKETEESIKRSERQMRSVVVELERSEHKASELAEKYRLERQRAEEASSAKSGFLANMSHELRTPLNAINGFSEIMVQQLYGPLGDRRYLTYATDILNSGKHLLDLINDVLDMAKLEAGKFKIYPKPMDLQETIEQSMRLVRGRAEEKNIALVGELNEAGDVTGDARAIKQIMINLLSNAIKFTPQNGKILIQVKNNLDTVIIRVIDNGIGISAEDLPRLARPFEQVENEHARANQGSGLGLALSRSFAQMHGGSLTIASEVGVGTMVIVSLPRLAVIQQEAA